MSPSTTQNIHIAVVGAHLSGLPLNHQLTELNGTLVKAVKTAPDYKLFALPNAQPPKPGLLAVTPGEGSEIEAEIWELSAAGFGTFVAALPRPMCIGTLVLNNGDTVKGFLVESIATQGAEEISHLGGWRKFIEKSSVKNKSAQ